MFCKCFNPGKKSSIKKHIVLSIENKEIDLGEVEVEICNSSYCKSGYINPAKWSEINTIIKNNNINISEISLCRLIFSNYR